MSGPQAERNAKWASFRSQDEDEDDDNEDGQVEIGARDLSDLLRGSERGLDIRVHGDVRRDAGFVGHSQPYYEEELQKARSENAHLRQLNVRLQDELEIWVRKYKNVVLEDGDDGAEVDEEIGNETQGAKLEPWVASTQVMPPLLVAYDARIAELRTMVTAAERQLAEDREHIARLSQENNRLQADLENELQNRMNELESAPHEQNAGYSSGGQVGIVANETIAMLNSIVDTLKRENASLQERHTILNHDVERLTEQGSERDQQLIIITKNFQTAAASLRSAKEQLDEIRNERDTAMAQLREVQNQLNDLGVEYEKVDSAMQERERDNLALHHHLQKLRSEIEELAAKANEETELQEQRVAMSTKRTRQVQRELESVTEELDSMKSANQELALKHETLKRDYENLLAAMQSLRIEVHELKAREDGLKQLETQVRTEIESARLEKNQALAVATQRKDEINRLLEQQIIQAKEFEREKERAIRDKTAELRGTVGIRDTEIQESEKRAINLSHSVEIAKRDQLEANNRLEAYRKVSTEELRRMEVAMQKLVDRVEEAENKAIERENEAQKSMQNSNARIAEAEQERANMMEITQSLRNQLQNATVSIETMKSEMKRLIQESENTDKDAVRLRQELANLRLSSDSRLETAEQRLKLNEQKYTQRIAQQESKLQELDQEKENLQLVYDRQKAHHEEEMSSTMAHFERLVAEQKEECTRLRGRSEELAAQLLSLQHERTELNSAMKQQEAQIRKLEKSLYSAEKRASEAKEQVAELIESEEQRLRETSELRRKLDVAEVQTNRVIRERDAALSSLEEKNTSARMFLTESSDPLSSPPLRRAQHAPQSPNSRASRLRLETERRFF